MPQKLSRCGHVGCVGGDFVVDVLLEPLDQWLFGFELGEGGVQLGQHLVLLLLRDQVHLGGVVDVVECGGGGGVGEEVVDFGGGVVELGFAYAATFEPELSYVV